MSLAALPNGHAPRSIPHHSKEKDLPGGWIVQKFGGTSIGKVANKIALDIVRAGLARNRIAVVCSARSTTLKSEGTTNRLLRAAREAEIRSSTTYITTVDLIRIDHLSAARAAISTPSVLDQLETSINDECDLLVKILASAQHLEEVSVRVEDKIISKGEKLSCLFMAALLEDQGVPSQYVDLADIWRPTAVSSPVNGSSDSGGFSSKRRLDLAWYSNMAALLGEEVRKCGDKVPVMTGYFGSVPGGLLHSIGRGYTDLCAALVAVGVGAKELQIWKEVDGIFTADPRKVPTARLLASVTPSEASELTFYGSEVIHPFTMQQVISARIPIRIKNVMNPRGSGTLILPDEADDRSNKLPLHSSKLFRTKSVQSIASGFSALDRASPSGLLLQHQRPKRPTAVTIKHHIIILNVHSNKRTRAHGFLMNIFHTLDKWHLSVDLISSSEVHVSLAIHSDSPMLSSGGDAAGGGNGGGAAEEIRIRDASLEGALRDLAQYGEVDLAPNMAIVSLVGKQLKNMVGISGRLFSTLGQNNINIEMISQGASEINISCVIDEREADRALNVIHTNLFTFLD